MIKAAFPFSKRSYHWYRHCRLEDIMSEISSEEPEHRRGQDPTAKTGNDRHESSCFWPLRSFSIFSRSFVSVCSVIKSDCHTSTSASSMNIPDAWPCEPRIVCFYQDEILRPRMIYPTRNPIVESNTWNLLNILLCPVHVLCTIDSMNSYTYRVETSYHSSTWQQHILKHNSHSLWRECVDCQRVASCVNRIANHQDWTRWLHIFHYLTEPQNVSKMVW